MNNLYLDLREAAVDFYNKTIADKSVRIVAKTINDRDEITKASNRLRDIINLTLKESKE